MVVSVLVTTVWLSLIIAARYLVVAGAVWWLQWGRATGVGRRLNRQTPPAKQIAGEIRHSLVATPIYAFPAAVAFEAWRLGGTQVYTDWVAFPIWWIPLSFVLLLLIQDTHYYWTHRAMHHPCIFGWAHAAHHRSRDPSPFASFAFDPVEAAVTAWLIPLIVFFMPVHVGVLALLLILMTVTAVMNHCGWEIWPDRWVRRGVGSHLITATHHSRHHSHMRTNYGLYFRLWDRAMGTDAMPVGERPPIPTSDAMPRPVQARSA